MPGSRAMLRLDYCKEGHPLHHGQGFNTRLPMQAVTNWLANAEMRGRGYPICGIV
jgi:hypothetical protein